MAMQHIHGKQPGEYRDYYDENAIASLSENRRVGLGNHSELIKQAIHTIVIYFLSQA